MPQVPPDLYDIAQSIWASGSGLLKAIHAMDMMIITWIANTSSVTIPDGIITLVSIGAIIMAGAYFIKFVIKNIKKAIIISIIIVVVVLFVPTGGIIGQ